MVEAPGTRSYCIGMYNMRAKRSACHCYHEVFVEYMIWALSHTELLKLSLNFMQIYLVPTVPRQANYIWISMDHSERLVHSELPIEERPQGVYFHTATGQQRV